MSQNHQEYVDFFDSGAERKGEKGQARKEAAARKERRGGINRKKGEYTGRYGIYNVT